MDIQGVREVGLGEPAAVRDLFARLVAPGTDGGAAGARVHKVDVRELAFFSWFWAPFDEDVQRREMASIAREEGSEVHRDTTLRARVFRAAGGAT
jgi:hypothetical protein